MSLSRQQHYVLEVSVVYVGIHSEQPLEDDLDDIDEVLWERHS